MATVLSISQAKAQFLAVAERVASSGEEVVVTKRGQPLVRVVPFTAPPSLAGSVTYNVAEDEFVHGPLDPWDAERG
jgi:prevent-host-death family protein